MCLECSSQTIHVLELEQTKTASATTPTELHATTHKVQAIECSEYQQCIGACLTWVDEQAATTLSMHPSHRKHRKLLFSRVWLISIIYHQGRLPSHPHFSGLLSVPLFFACMEDLDMVASTTAESYTVVNGGHYSSYQVWANCALSTSIHLDSTRLIPS